MPCTLFDVIAFTLPTNIIEGYHRQLRKVTKNKGAFPNDMALVKLVYLATRNISKKWTQPLPNWGLVAQQSSIRFGSRMLVRFKN